MDRQQDNAAGFLLLKTERLRRAVKRAPGQPRAVFKARAGVKTEGDERPPCGVRRRGEQRRDLGRREGLLLAGRPAEALNYAYRVVLHQAFIGGDTARTGKDLENLVDVRRAVAGLLQVGPVGEEMLLAERFQPAGGPGPRNASKSLATCR